MIIGKVFDQVILLFHFPAMLFWDDFSPIIYVYCSTKIASQQLFGKEIKMSIFKLFTFETQYTIFCILNVISLLLKALCNLRVFSYEHDCRTFLDEFSENFSRKIYLSSKYC